MVEIGFKDVQHFGLNIYSFNAVSKILPEEEKYLKAYFVIEKGLKVFEGECDFWFKSLSNVKLFDNAYHFGGFFRAGDLVFDDFDIDSGEVFFELSGIKLKKIKRFINE